jgi:hypothetical protein
MWPATPQGVEWIRGIAQTLVLRDPIGGLRLGREAGSHLGKCAGPGYLNRDTVILPAKNAIGCVRHVVVPVPGSSGSQR